MPWIVLVPQSCASLVKPEIKPRFQIGLQQNKSVLVLLIKDYNSTYYLFIINSNSQVLGRKQRENKTSSSL